MRRSLIPVLLVLLYAVVLAAQARSKWVHPGPEGRLQYAADARGNQIMDFSYAGYKGGGVALPNVRVARAVKPIDGDNTAHVQGAIDEVAKLPLDANGFRGALLLEQGTYELGGTLRIAASGIVLRGGGSSEKGSVLRVTGKPHRLLDIAGEGARQIVGQPAAITDAYVPSGSNHVTVNSPNGFQPGDAVLVQRPVTDAWIHLMGMDLLTRDGKPQTWIKAGTLISADRTIKSISGNTITFDVPVSDSYDAKYLNPPGASVVKYLFPGRIEQVGVESLRVMAPAQDQPLGAGQYTLLSMNAVSDAWVRDVVSVDTHDSTSYGPTARRITVQNVHIIHTIPFTAPAAPADFAFSGTQILLDRSSVKGQGVWPVVTQNGVTGPNVVLHFKSETAGVAPHQRWATGLLVDDSELTGGTEKRPNIAFSNREYAGSGHGWSVGFAVGWNVKADYVLLQQPPGSMNWCIGCTGKPPTVLWHDGKIPIPKIPSETWESPGVRVAPASLYLAQLQDRLGAAAVKAIGY